MAAIGLPPRAIPGLPPSSTDRTPCRLAFPAGAGTAATVLQGLASLCCDAAQQQAGTVLQQTASALGRLSAYWPAEAAPLAAPLALLLLHPGVGVAEARALLPLLLQLEGGSVDGSRHSKDSGHSAAAGAATVAALEVPLVELLAFGTTSSEVREWASFCMQQIERQIRGAAVRAPGSQEVEQQPGASGQGQQRRQHEPDLPGALSLVLLRELWANPAAAEQWLSSLHLSLASSSGSAGGPRSGKLAGGREQRRLAPPALLLLAALLAHPAPAVAGAAVAVAVGAAAAVPLLGLTLLPLLVLQLQRQVETFLSGKPATEDSDPPGPNQQARLGRAGSGGLAHRPPRRPSPLLLQLLQALPLLAQHPAALPFVLRALQPLLAPAAPPLLQAAGLRLLCALWVGTSRAFQQLRTALIGELALCSCWGGMCSWPLPTCKLKPATSVVCQAYPASGVLCACPVKVVVFRINKA